MCFLASMESFSLVTSVWFDTIEKIHSKAGTVKAAKLCSTTALW